GEELAEEAPGPPLGEPARAEALPEVLAQRGLEAPCAQVVDGVEALVDVREPAALWPRDAQGVREEPLVAVGLAVEGARAVEPELVLELRRVAAHEVEAQGGRLAAVVVQVAPAEHPLEPGRVVDEALEQERVALGDRVVAEVAELERQRRRRP